jgi:hypothetical protein
MKISRRVLLAATLATGISMSVFVPVAVAQQPFEGPSTGAKKAPFEGTSIVGKNVAEVPDTPPRQGFSIVLLLGDMQGPSTQEELPPAAARALADMKDFLPYKSYRLLDTQWTLCCSGSSAAMTRLRGVEDQEYELELKGAADPAGYLNVRFFLREPADALSQALADKQAKLTELEKRALTDQHPVMREIQREIFTLERERVDLEAKLATAQKQFEVGVKDKTELPRLEAQLVAVRGRIRDLQKDLKNTPSPKAGGRTVIDTSFRMEVGETVVVGTSRLRGGSRALIALLTAVPKPKTSKR